MRRRRASWAFLLLALLVAAGVPTPVAAVDHVDEVGWSYLVKVPAHTTGRLDVELSLSGAKGVVNEFRFRPDAAPFPISSFRCLTAACTIDGDSVVLTVDENVERVAFHVDVNRGSPRGDAYVSYLGPDWGVVKAEALSIPFRYQYPGGADPTWSTTVTFVLPPGWRTSAAWERVHAGDPDRYALPAGEALPRGFVALGAYTEETKALGERSVRYARLGNAPTFEEAMFDHLRGSTDYLRGVYGDSVGPVVLVVSAPSPMLTGGLGAHDGFFVHESADLRTAAHEFAHVWQRFAGEPTPGDSSIWFHEGDAELHGTLSLFASGHWSLDEVNDYFRKTYDARREAPLSTLSLEEATYTEDGERVAYGKGAIVLAALDTAIASNTDGRFGLPDLLQALNDAAREGGAAATTVTNDEVLLALANLTGLDFGNYFAQFVEGTQWPVWDPFEGRGHVLVTNISVSPPLPRAGTQVTVVTRIENRGYAENTTTFDLKLDGTVIASRDITLDVAGHQVVTWTLTAPAQGEHEVRVGAASTTFRVATPAYLVVEDIRTVPGRPHALAPADLLVYVHNKGDFPTTGRVVLLVNHVFEDEQDLTVGRNSTTAAIFTVRLPEEGENVVTARVYAEGRFASQNVTIDVGPTDRDGDGVPDVDDPYPEDPEASEKSLWRDAKQRVPAPGAAVVAAAAMLAVAFTGARAPRRRRP